MATHTGSFDYHEDDCRCVEGGRHCNRDASCWSCCGACKEDSECSGTRLHPTHWQHPRFQQTVSGFDGRHRPTFKSNEAIRALAPESFD